MTRTLLLGACLLLAAGCDEPYIVLPGGALQGTVEGVPADWTEQNEVEVIQLETRLDDPYSVNIWTAGIGKHLYVATSKGGTRWTEHLSNSQDVRVRFASTIYELEAVPVTDPTERDLVAAEYVRKYDVDGDDNWVSAGRIYRLDRR